MKKTYLIVAFTLLLSATLFSKEKEITIKIVETSDVHGSFFPYDFITRRDVDGSLARAMTFVKNLREGNLLDYQKAGGLNG